MRDIHQLTTSGKAGDRLVTFTENSIFNLTDLQNTVRELQTGLSAQLGNPRTVLAVKETLQKVWAKYGVVD